MGEGTVLVPLRPETYRFDKGEREPFRTESGRDRGERGRPFLVRRHPLPPETATHEFSCVGAGNVFVWRERQGNPPEEGSFREGHAFVHRVPCEKNISCWAWGFWGAPSC